MTKTTESNVLGIIDRFLYAMMEGEHARCAALIKEFREIDGILSILVDGHPLRNFSKLLTPQRGARL